MEHVEIAVLGETVVSLEGRPVSLAKRDCAVATALAIQPPGEWVPRGTIEALAWPVAPPTSRALGSSVYRLRQALGYDAIQVRRTMLRCNAERCTTDLERVRTGSWSTADELVATCALFRGVPFASLHRHPLWGPERARWVARYRGLVERATAALELEGRFGDIDELSWRSRAVLASSGQDPSGPVYRFAITSADGRTIEVSSEARELEDLVPLAVKALSAMVAPSAAGGSEQAAVAAL